jgi:hypothetical protein
MLTNFTKINKREKYEVGIQNYLASKTTTLHLRYEMFSSNRKMWIGILEILQQTMSTTYINKQINK